MHHSYVGRVPFIPEEHDVGTDHRSFAEGSKREKYDMSQDTIVNYTGTHYVRVLKLFEAPANYRKGTNEYKQVQPEYNRTFHLRYYIPKSTLISKGERVKQIVIMFNGLNEVNRFDLYDVFGEYFAEQGIAAVLLPTPYHLNRNGPIKKSPHVALFDNPMLMYYNYKQSVLESKLLIRKLRQEKTARDKNDLGFYESLFDRDLQVSILGFSLGGLRALASFILDPKEYHTCIVFNSGVNLFKLNTELIDISNDAWLAFAHKLHELAKKPPRGARGGHSALWEAFNWVFLGSEPTKLSTRLMKHSERLLFILSGADPTLRSEKISILEVEGHGLNVFRIGGVGHIPTLDPKWTFWFDRVSELMVGFIRAPTDLWSRQGIVAAIKSALKDPDDASRLLNAKVSKIPQLRDFLKHVKPAKRPEMIDSYYAAMAYYPRFRDVLKRVVKSVKRAKKRKQD